MNLLLVSIDSLRFDFVSRTNPAIHTPRFDALSRSFSFSDQCFSVSSATRPVHTTLFTGLYPSEHGVLGQRSPRMRPGLPHLFPLLAGAGYQVAGFSQAPTIFAGLDYEPWIAPLEERALAKALGGAGRRGVFLHYWDTHAPYGAADRKAMGSTAALLRQGRRSEVIAVYQRAVATTFEQHLAPLLAGLDLDRWMVLICGDHGQSWTTAEPYHGQTLDNSVLRVPSSCTCPAPAIPPSRPCSPWSMSSQQWRGSWAWTSNTGDGAGICATPTGPASIWPNWTQAAPRGWNPDSSAPRLRAGNGPFSTAAGSSPAGRKQAPIASKKLFPARNCL